MNHADQMELEKRIKEENDKRLGEAAHFAEYLLLWKEVHKGDDVRGIEAYERRYYGEGKGFRVTHIDV